MSEIYYLLSLIRIALGEQKEIDVRDNVCIDDILKMINNQNLILLVYPILCGRTDKNLIKIENALKEAYNKELHRSIFQQMDMDNLLFELKKHHVESLPLKGYIMREFYPDITMRSMTDFDILIHSYNPDKMNKIMTGIGYEVKLPANEHHDVYVKKPYTVVELHKRLSHYHTDEDKTGIDYWLDEIWSKCSKAADEECIYCLSDEDFYIYHLLHMYQHMKSSGCGIRPLIDIYVFLKAKEEFLNWTYIRNVLSELKVDKFESVMRTLAQNCFSEKGKELTEEENMLLVFMNNGNLFGSTQIYETTKIVKTGKDNFLKNKVKRMLDIAFPKLKSMKTRYPILEKYPGLLPFCWLIRIIRLIFTNKDRMDAFLENSNRKQYEFVARIHEIVGMEK